MLQCISHRQKSTHRYMYMYTCVHLYTCKGKYVLYSVKILDSWKQEAEHSCHNNSAVNISLCLIDAKHMCSYIEKLMSDNGEFGM